MSAVVSVKSRFRVTDLLKEIIRSLAASPMRAAGTAAGVVLASAAFVANLGLSATLSHQVSDAFDTLRATEIVVTDNDSATGTVADGALCPALPLPDVRRLAGVQAAGAYNFVRDRPVRTRIGAGSDLAAPLVGIDAGSLSVLGPHLTSGRLSDHGHDLRGDSVAIVPDRLAEKLGIPGVGTAIEIGTGSVTVIGTFDDLQRRPDALDAVLMPSTAMDRLLGASVDPGDVSCGAVIATASGAAGGLSQQVAVALMPQDPAGLTVVAPPDPQSFRRQLERPVRTLTYALSAAAMLIGIIAIGTTASSSVASRVSEIGLRKAIGARSRHILLQLLGESVLLGLLGATAGVFVGSFAVIGVSLANTWQPVLDFRAALLSCLGGSVIGALAGLLPAVKAARIPAVESLRR